MSPILLSYTAYSVAATGLTIGLAATLARHGHVFLHDVFPRRPELAKSINQLLVVGFFMLNLGYAFFLMRQNVGDTGREVFEGLATKLGQLLVSLAVIHFINVAVFWKIRGSQRLHHMPPPVAPAATLATA